MRFEAHLRGQLQNHAGSCTAFSSLTTACCTTRAIPAMPPRVTLGAVQLKDNEFLQRENLLLEAFLSKVGR